MHKCLSCAISNHESQRAFILFINFIYSLEIHQNIWKDKRIPMQYASVCRFFLRHWSWCLIFDSKLDLSVSINWVQLCLDWLVSMDVLYSQQSHGKSCHFIMFGKLNQIKNCMLYHTSWQYDLASNQMCIHFCSDPTNRKCHINFCALPFLSILLFCVKLFSFIFFFKRHTVFR